MIIGQLKTANYEFTTLDNTVAECLENLKNAWENHAWELGAWYGWDVMEDSVTMLPIRPGDTLNDCELCENALSHKGKK